MNLKKAALLLATASLALSACAQRAVTNVQTFVSSDCGKNWSMIDAGESIPRQLLPCDLRVSIPNYPMQGEANFKVGFKNNVLVWTSSSYEYSIIDGLAFLRNARYIGKQNSAGDDAANSANSYETAENLLIDRRLREIADAMLDQEDIVTFDSSKFEERLLEEANKALQDRGIRIESIAFVPTPDDQTKMAIDAGAAIRVYDAAGIGDLGKQMMIARAGAAVVTTTVNQEKFVQPAE
jgi:hypothetical protein